MTEQVEDFCTANQSTEKSNIWSHFPRTHQHICKEYNGHKGLHTCIICQETWIGD